GADAPPIRALPPGLPAKGDRRLRPCPPASARTGKDQVRGASSAGDCGIRPHTRPCDPALMLHVDEIDVNVAACRRFDAVVGSGRAGEILAIDRKSTRLNSSHVA